MAYFVWFKKEEQENGQSEEKAANGARERTKAVPKVRRHLTTCICSQCVGLHYLLWLATFAAALGALWLSANAEMSEIWSLLPQVPQHVEEQSARFRGVYTDMQERFIKNGLNLEEIAEVRKGFRGTEVAVTASPGKTPITPRIYTEDFPGGPLPWTSVRLLVLPLDRNHKLSSAGACSPPLD